MSLRFKVLSFIDAARRNPAQASNAEWLNTLEADAFSTLDGAYYAECAPVAPFTWEQRVILLGSDIRSERMPFRFPYAVQILGFRSVVAPLQPANPGGALDPGSITGLGTDIVDVLVDVNEENNLTSGNGITTPGGPNNGNFVTLSALDIQAPRLHAIDLVGESPDVGFTFRWKLGVNQFQDSLISCAMYIRPLSDRGASWNGPDIGRRRR
jgi:hypothetical protein